MARRDRRDNPPEKDADSNGGMTEMERESLSALKGILSKVAGLLKPLGLSPEESTYLVETMYESVLELDRANAGEPDDVRRKAILQHVNDAEVRRVDDELKVEFPRA